MRSYYAPRFIIKAGTDCNERACLLHVFGAVGHTSVVRASCLRACPMEMNKAWPFVLYAIGVCFKLLLFPSYRSTDFDVHRNWLAITSSLPVSQWYLDQTSEWTLDYPPFFAWFEWLLAKGALLFDRQMLVVSATPYASPGTIVYQRLTVIATDSILLLGAYAQSRSTLASPKLSSSVVITVSLTFLNTGLLLVDHVHFQYNGMLIGLLLLSCGALAAGKNRWAAFAFAVLLNLKHLFLFAAPLYFVQLLRDHVLQRHPPLPLRAAAVRRLMSLAALVLGVFTLSIGPFAVIGQLGQLATRLFPFGRGLIHAYWAPNAWALYTFADRLGTSLASKLLPKLGMSEASVLRVHARGGNGGGSSGIIGETVMHLLPSIGATTTGALVLLAQAPVLIGTWKAPRPSAFAPALAYCGLTTYIFGYHVHEKALLPPLLVLMAMSPPAENSVAARLHARLLVLLSSAGHYAILPLLHAPAEWSLERLLSLAYLIALTLVLRWRMSAPHIGLKTWEVLYLFGFLPLEAFCSFLHPALLASRMPFLPLMGTSVYCAIGVLYATRLSYLLWAEYSADAMHQCERD